MSSAVKPVTRSKVAFQMFSAVTTATRRKAGTFLTLVSTTKRVTKKQHMMYVSFDVITGKSCLPTQAHNTNIPSKTELTLVLCFHVWLNIGLAVWHTYSVRVRFASILCCQKYFILNLGVMSNLNVNFF